MEEHLSLPAGIRQSLGAVVMEWARVEALVGEFLSYLLKADPGAMYVLNQEVGCGTQIKWIRVLAYDRFTNDNTRANLKILFDRLDAARGERNAYVHGIWIDGPEPNTAIVQTVKVDRAEMIRDELVTVSDLDDLFSEIRSVALELHQISEALGFLSK